MAGPCELIPPAAACAWINLLIPGSIIRAATGAGRRHRRPRQHGEEQRRVLVDDGIFHLPRHIDGGAVAVPRRPEQPRAGRSQADEQEQGKAHRHVGRPAPLGSARSHCYLSRRSLMGIAMSALMESLDREH